MVHARRPAVLAAALAAGLLASACAPVPPAPAASGTAPAVAATGPQPAAARFVVAPYKDVVQHAAKDRPRMTARIGAGGPLRALPDRGLHGGTLVWAFASGECGAEHWGGLDADRFAAANVPAFVAAGVDYALSTGGEAGVFTCASDEGMRRFVARYDSPRLTGIDFDIEGQQTPEQVDALAARARALQRERPGLRLSFTLATHGASDGSGRNLNALGQSVLAALRRHGADGAAVINLMVMNYGPPDARWCVPKADASACDMAASALQAARNLHEQHGVPYRQIALTLMLGENDVAANTTTLADASTVARRARELGMAGVYWWSLDRDQPCPPGGARVSPHCHALPGVAAGAFRAAIEAAATR
jgi:hypothetical protein